jgi:hypothetical protein
MREFRSSGVQELQELQKFGRRLRATLDRNGGIFHAPRKPESAHPFGNS